jgi:transposase-like protein
MPDYEFHPLAETWPMLAPAELAELTADIQAHGLRDDITRYEGKILDGRNRYLACLQAAVEPRFADLPEGEDPAAWVESKNDFRRHLSPAFQQKRREERQRAVARLRREGHSTRSIADRIDVSRAQVRRDIDDAGGPPGPPEPVKGRDGKTYPTKPKRARKTSPPKAETNGIHAPPDDDPDPTPERGDAYVPPDPNAVLDALGRPVPDCLRDVFAEPALPDLIAELESWSGAARFAGWKSAVKRLADAYPYLRGGDFFVNVDAIADALDTAVRCLRDGLPYAPCPKCGGTRCEKCRLGGHVPQWRLGEVKEEIRLQGGVS